MNYRKRKFFAGEYLHVYQRTIEGVNIFYDRIDYLVFFTIFSTIAKLYDITILQLCIMIDHIHILVASDKLEEVASFLRHYTSHFVQVYNLEIGRNGQLFHKSYGSAPKKGNKKIRSTIVYIGNNPVEKSLCMEASEYRWNFLGYALDKNPYSNKVPRKNCPPRIRSIMKEIEENHIANKHLSYAQLRRIFAKLSASEKEFVTDYIISTYYPFDTKELLSFYNSYSDMINAMKSTAGNEYDIKEKYYQGSDKVYDEMIEYVEKVMNIKPARLITAFSAERKFEIAKQLQRATKGSTMQISKFVHLKILNKGEA